MPCLVLLHFDIESLFFSGEHVFLEFNFSLKKILIISPQKIFFFQCDPICLITNIFIFSTVESVDHVLCKLSSSIPLPSIISNNFYISTCFFLPKTPKKYSCHVSSSSIHISNPTQSNPPQRKTTTSTSTPSTVTTIDAL